MQWFKVEKVKASKGSKELPESSRVLGRDGIVMNKDDIPLYKMLDFRSYIEIYDRHNYFLARQYLYDYHTRTSILHSEYKLTLTDEAWKIVNALLKAPFECKVEQNIRKRGYTCSAIYPIRIPIDNNNIDEKGWWAITISAEYDYVTDADADDIGTGAGTATRVSIQIAMTIPFNCGPLRPAWEQVVKCWMNKLAKKPRKYNIDIDACRKSLLSYQYLNLSIVPVYYLYP